MCRALSLVATNVMVDRDMFYNGDVMKEPGAVVCRLSPSFVRFGTFQLPVSRGKEEMHLTRKLADFVIAHHFSELGNVKNKYSLFLQEVVKRTAVLVAKWQLLGFVHGVHSLCGALFHLSPMSPRKMRKFGMFVVMFWFTNCLIL